VTTDTTAERIRILDQSIIADRSLGREKLESLRVAQRELGLLHGDRPTCPFLRPHILGRPQYEEIKTTAEILAKAFEKVASGALTDPRVMSRLRLTTTEEQLSRIDPGYSDLCVTSRLDSYLTPEGFKFLEYNAETPAGVGDQMQLEKVLFSIPSLREFLDQNEHWRPQPHKRLLESLQHSYREWGGEEDLPQIAIVDWRGVPTESEFAVLRDYFLAMGHPTIIADPHELSYDGDRLWAGEFRIDILYKRVIIHEFLREFDGQHPLVQAYREHRVCMANSFRTKLAHKKGSLAVLTDPEFAYLYTPIEQEMIRAHVPWTRVVEQATTSFEDIEHDLLSLIRDQRERFVLKPNDDYGGHGIFLGWETDEETWRVAVSAALTKPYVVQERAPAQKISIPAFSNEVAVEEMFVDFNPFLFRNEVEGALIRLSSSSLLNVTSGGGQTALLVLET
jgi:circularly permuted ATPgrasp domain protein